MYKIYLYLPLFPMLQKNRLLDGTTIDFGKSELTLVQLAKGDRVRIEGVQQNYPQYTICYSCYFLVLYLRENHGTYTMGDMNTVILKTLVVKEKYYEDGK